MQTENQDVQIGQAFPIGSTVMGNGVNFSIFSKNATRIELLLFDDADAVEAADILVLDKKSNRTDFYWHIFVPGLQAGQLYGYRVHGLFLPELGHRFDPQKVLLDPYSKSVVVPEQYDRKLASRPGDNVATAMKSVVVDTVTTRSIMKPMEKITRMEQTKI